jgi:hypothetical protein
VAVRERDAESERVVQRLVQLSAITDVLRELTDIARDEEVHPPVRTDANQPLSRVPSRLSQLRAALSIYERLGGPFMNQASQLASMGYNSGTPLMQVLGLAQSALGEAIAPSRRARLARTTGVESASIERNPCQLERPRGSSRSAPPSSCYDATRCSRASAVTFGLGHRTAAGRLATLPSGFGKPSAHRTLG